MEGKLKSFSLVGAGALFGSVSTFFILRLLHRRIANQAETKATKLCGNGHMVETTVKDSPVVGCTNRGIFDVDLLTDEIVSEQLTRNIQFFGLSSQKNVTASYVVVIGLGGVGSHAAMMLLRSGVGRLLLVDFDQVSLSSLNRHAVATRADVGVPKAQCLKEHFLSIFPECQVEAKVLLYDAASEEEILSGKPDFVLDCIDNIDTKVSLLAACVRRGLKVLSATGAGARADPTRIRVADLRESTNDPLSRAVRHRLRKGYGIEGGIPVVFSLEKPKAKLLPFQGPSGEAENPSDYQVPFLQFLDRLLHQRLIEHEESLYGTAMQVQVDVEEVMFVAKELWHGRSARDQSAKDVGRGMWRAINELMLVRWDRAKPASVANLILLKFKEADEHESSTLDDIKEKEPEFFRKVNAILKRAEMEFSL
ncbi:tRNA threonylcarbamoyladenosine dehydratase isoform X2 [Benincasa hispida]|uniref:tRNA threonylcarbamoyladenosine dehydratase isoform X2 n=1 Tax=Benincasa hispida TaxID=102211 RepID=UPI00190117AE|nr:tRNA threonylcarbamoyladenosine dehydratase isoform X2 [Benincasa hispida]